MVAARAAGLECFVILSKWTRDGDFRYARKVLASIREVPEEILRRANGAGSSRASHDS
jgi:hypothetical protein